MDEHVMDAIWFGLLFGGLISGIAVAHVLRKFPGLWYRSPPWPSRPDDGIRGPKSDTPLSEVRFPTAPSGVVRVSEVGPHDAEDAFYGAVRSMSGEAWERLRERMDARDQDLNEGPDPLFAKKTPLDGEGGGP